MAQHTILENDVTEQLVKEAQEGSKESMQKLVEHNTRLIWSVIHKFGLRGHSREDLFQVGSIGFINAVGRFNPDFGCKFNTYAVPMIYGELQKYNRDSTRPGAIRANRTLSDMVYKINKENLTEKSPEEISILLDTDNLELIKDALRYIAEDFGSLKYLDSKAFNPLNTEEGEVTYLNLLQGDANGENWFNRIVLQEAMDKLPEKQRKIIDMVFFKGMTQREIASELGVNQVQISRLQKKILKKLKLLLEEGLDE